LAITFPVLSMTTTSSSWLAAHPQVAIVVDRDPVRSIDAGDEIDASPRCRPFSPELDDLMNAVWQRT